MKKIEVISSCLVRTICSGNPRTIELMPWDLQFLPLDPIQKGLLFHRTFSDQDFHERTTLIHHLKTSLSRTLELFFPLSGRLKIIDANPEENNDNVCIFLECNNAGFEFTHAIARGVSVSDIVDQTHVPEIVYNFFPLNGIPNYKGTLKPLAGVQVTELTDGFFIGCTMNHCVADGTSFWHFFKSWSEISTGSDTTMISKPPDFRRLRTPINNLRISLPSLEEQKNVSKSGPTSHTHLLVERVFHFNKESIAKLKAMANARADQKTAISSFQALCTHLWRAVIRGRIRSNQISRNEDVTFKLLVGARGRIPLPDGYFGAAVHAVDLLMNADELLQPDGLSQAASKLNELVAKQTSGRVVQFLEDWVKSHMLLRRGTTSFVISSSPRFDVYGCDFGWGKPIAVRCGMGQKSDGKMTLFPAKDPCGGTDVEACLAPETLEAMENDAEFMEAVDITP